MPEVHFCKNNLSKGIDKLRDKIEEELPDVEVRIERCLEFCHDCALHPIAIIKGTFINADTVDSLYESIKEELK